MNNGLAKSLFYESKADCGLTLTVTQFESFESLIGGSYTGHNTLVGVNTHLAENVHNFSFAIL